MNWYKHNIKTASFIKQIQISGSGRDWLNIWINGKRYEYKNVPISKISEIKKQIHELKQMKNLHQAGSKLSKIIRQMDKFLQKKK